MCDETVTVAMSNQPILCDTGHDKYKLPHMRDAAWLAVRQETGMKHKKKENGPITSYFAVSISKLANSS